MPQRSTLDQQLVLTAYHEAAHAIVALRFGVVVHEVSLVPNEAQNSLGHVLHTAPPPPRPVDCYPDTFWTRAQTQILLSGYLIEDLLWGPPGKTPVWRTDHHRALALFRAFSGRSRAAAWELLKPHLEDAVTVLFDEAIFDEIASLAEHLLGQPHLAQDEFYRRVTDGVCGAVDPSDGSRRCDMQPHRYGRHLHRVHGASGDWDDWSWGGFPTERAEASSDRRSGPVVRGEPGRHG